jgi:hypothetical protein
LCALSDDRVVEIQGEARVVQRAMELVVSHLRKFLVDHSVLTLFELNVSPTSLFIHIHCFMLNVVGSQKTLYSEPLNVLWGSIDG